MTTSTSGRAACILAIGFLMGFAGPSLAQSADNTATDNASVAAPANPADSQAAPANQAAGNDQLSDADRAARQDDVKTPDVKTPVIVTQTETPARKGPVVAGSQNASWDETTLIGKIFIGLGAILTVASAARMFMA